MSKKEKRKKKLMSLPTDMGYEEVDLILKDNNFKIENIRGSHFIYVNGDRQITIVKHNKKVKKCYLKDIIDILDLEE